MTLHPHPKPTPSRKVLPTGPKGRIRLKGQRRFPGRENPVALELIRQLPCAPCRHFGLRQESPTEVEHWVTKARGGYDVGDTFPTCAHHRELRHNGDGLPIGAHADRWCAETCRWLCHQPGVLESGSPLPENT